ncbi:MAG: hypothetical protein ABIJ05_02795 [Patescibacteria group bacterium]
MEPLNNSNSVDTQQIGFISKIKKSRNIFRVLLFLQISIAIFSLIFSIYFIKKYVEVQKTCNKITVTAYCTTDPTAKWLNYENNVIGIKFKYPPTWTYKEDNSIKKVVFSTKNHDPLEKKEQEIPDFISIQSFTNEEFNKWKTKENPTQLTESYFKERKYDMYLSVNKYKSLNYVYNNNEGTIYVLSKYPYTPGNYLESSNSIITQLIFTFEFTYSNK